MYNFKVVLLSKKSLVGVERAIRISLVILSKGKVAQIPFDVFIGVKILLDSEYVKESVNTNVIDTSIISCLFETFSV